MLLPKLYFFFSNVAKRLPAITVISYKTTLCPVRCPKIIMSGFCCVTGFDSALWAFFWAEIYGGYIALYCQVLLLLCPAPVDCEGCFFFLLIIQIHCPYLIKSNNWSYTQLYQPDPSGHSHYLTAGVLALYFLRLSCNQMATGSIFETANLQCHDVL